MAATLVIGALVAQQIAGKATRDALFLSAFDVRRLPLMVTAGSLFSAGAVLVFSRAMARRSPARVVPAALSAAGVLLLAEWGLSLWSAPVAAAIFYLHLSFFGAALVSGFWSLVNERFDPHAAKRHIGRIGTGASVGGVLGGLLALAASRWIPAPAMLLLLAALSALALAALHGLKLAGQPPAEPAPPAAAALPGIDAFRSSQYLRSLALFVAVAAVAESLLEYQLATAVVGGGRPRAELMGFFAAYQTVVALLGLAAQAGLARRSLESVGLAGTAALKPASLVVTGLAGVIAPGLEAALAARGCFGVLHNSLFRSAYELLYTPLPEQRKRPTKALVDVGADRLGAAAGGLVAAVVVSLLPSASARALSLLALILGLGLLLLCHRLHDGYVGSLADSLRSGAVRLAPEDVVDRTTLYTLTWTTMSLEQGALLRRLAQGAAQDRDVGDTPTSTARDVLLQSVAALRSSDSAAVRRALAGEAYEPALVGHVLPLLARNDVFLDALRWLRMAAPHATGQLVDALLDEDRPFALRRRLPRVLRACPSQRAAEGLCRGLSAGEFELRFECAAALERLTERNPALEVPAEVLLKAAGRLLREWPADADDEVRSRGLEHLFHLLAPIQEREPLKVALWALRSESRLRGTAIEYLGSVLPVELRSLLFGALQLEAGGRARDPRQLRQELVTSAPAPKAESDGD